eukprot:Awhi_evm2s87
MNEGWGHCTSPRRNVFRYHGMSDEVFNGLYLPLTRAGEPTGRTPTNLRRLKIVKCCWILTTKNLRSAGIN